MAAIVNVIKTPPTKTAFVGLKTYLKIYISNIYDRRSSHWKVCACSHKIGVDQPT